MGLTKVSYAMINGAPFNILDFGAVGDGITDNTDAINLAYSSLPPSSALYFPSGVYRYTSKITFSGNKHTAFFGDGPTQSILMYDGSVTNDDCIVIGDGAQQEENWIIQNIGFRTAVNTTAGALCHFKSFCRSTIENVTFMDQDYSYTTPRPYIGLWLDGADMVKIDGIQAMGSQECFRLNGLVSGPKSDVYVSNSKFLFSEVGIHIGGAFGGFYIDSSDVIRNKTNVLIDKAVVNENNRETFFGSGCYIDSAGTGGGSVSFVYDGINVDIQDTSGFISFSNTWVASAGNLMRTGDSFAGNVVINGGIWFNTYDTGGLTGDAILIGSTSTSIEANSINFFLINGNCFNCTAGSPSQLVYARNCFFIYVLQRVLNVSPTYSNETWFNTSMTVQGRFTAGAPTTVPVSTSSNPVGTFAAGGSDLGATLAVPYFANSVNAPWLELCKSRNETIGSHTIVQTGDAIGGIAFAGSNGSQFLTGAWIRGVIAGGTPGANNMPTKLEFYTREDGATGVGIRAAFTETGNFAPYPDNTYSCGQNFWRWSSVWAANGTIQTSDKNAKTDIQPSVLGLDFINSLKPVSYKFIVGGNKVEKHDEDGQPVEIIPIPGKRTHWGLIAQEVKEVLPEGTDFGGWIKTDMNNPNSEEGLRYDEFVAPMIKAIQELSNKVSELELKLESQKIDQ